MTHTCQHCNRELPLDNFPFIGRGGNRKASGQRNSMCRECLAYIRRIIKNKAESERKKIRRQRKREDMKYHIGRDVKPPEKIETEAAEEIAANDILMWEPTLQDLIAWRKSHPEKERFEGGGKGSAIQEEHPSDVRFLNEMNKRAGRADRVCKC
jgi:hypothetical protein